MFKVLHYSLRLKFFSLSRFFQVFWNPFSDSELENVIHFLKSALVWKI